MKFPHKSQRLILSSNPLKGEFSITTITCEMPLCTIVFLVSIGQCIIPTSLIQAHDTTHLYNVFITVCSSRRTTPQAPRNKPIMTPLLTRTRFLWKRLASRPTLLTKKRYLPKRKKDLGFGSPPSLPS